MGNKRQHVKWLARQHAQEQSLKFKHCNTRSYQEHMHSHDIRLKDTKEENYHVLGVKLILQLQHGHFTDCDVSKAQPGFAVEEGPWKGICIERV